jgi:hypothetical protein
MAARLKVFVTSDGLTDYVVAVSSRAKALAAWGVRQDVFKEGAAHETDDPALVTAALARPGQVLRTPAGTRGKLAKLKRAKRAEPKGPTKAQLKRLADLQAKLTELEAEHERAVAAIGRAQVELDRRRQAVDERHAQRRERLEAAIRTAQSALE